MREKILFSARKLFLEKGYSKTTLKDIVKDAETSIGNCYFYYKNKETILAEIIKKDSENGDLKVAALIKKYKINDLIKRISTIVYVHSIDFLTDENIIKLYLMGASFPSIRKITSEKIKNHLTELYEFKDKSHKRIFNNQLLEIIDLFPTIYKSVIIGIAEAYYLGEFDKTVDEMVEVIIKWVLMSLNITKKEIDENLDFLKSLEIPENK